MHLTVGLHQVIARAKRLAKVIACTLRQAVMQREELVVESSDSKPQAEDYVIVNGYRMVSQWGLQWGRA